MGIMSWRAIQFEGVVDCLSPSRTAARAARRHCMEKIRPVRRQPQQHKLYRLRLVLTCRR